MSANKISFRQYCQESRLERKAMSQALNHIIDVKLSHSQLLTISECKHNRSLQRAITKKHNDLLSADQRLQSIVNGRLTKGSRC